MPRLYSSPRKMRSCSSSWRTRLSQVSMAWPARRLDTAIIASTAIRVTPAMGMVRAPRSREARGHAAATLSVVGKAHAFAVGAGGAALDVDDAGVGVGVVG